MVVYVADVVSCLFNLELPLPNSIFPFFLSSFLSFFSSPLLFFLTHDTQTGTVDDF